MAPGPSDVVLQRQLDQWELRPDGDAIDGRGSIVQPVRSSDGTRAVLKIGHPDAESEHEHLVLRRWGGDGAVRLLSADPPHRALLLERLHAETLRSLGDVAACDVVAGLYGRLHIPAMPQLRSLTSELELWTGELESLPRSAPVPRRLIEQAIGLGRDLSTEPAAVVLHGNLHYGTVLAHRWNDVTGDVRDAVRRRFYRLVEASGFDEERARAWTIIRVVRNATRDPAHVTTYVAVAKAIQE